MTLSSCWIAAVFKGCFSSRALLLPVAYKRSDPRHGLFEMESGFRLGVSLSAPFTDLQRLTESRSIAAQLKRGSVVGYDKAA